MRLEDEIKQTKPIGGVSKAILNVLVTADRISSRTNSVLKPFGISKEQYNVLRILRGQRGKPCPLQTISERMISQSSNASRLVDKLVAKSLVERTTCPTNRRQLDLVITAAGLNLLERADGEMSSAASQYGDLTDQEAIDLNNLLDKLRG